MAINGWASKYRPSQVSELIGQKSVSVTLVQASKQNRFGNSYVFSGNKGCGKTTSARILANLMTCENVKEGVLCGNCVACTKIGKGFSPDIIEIDAGQDGGVDEMKKVVDSLSYSPTELKRKVVILDECHLLSKAAISSLLKIVEEPPKYICFVFCTTEVNKIPATILSRSQRFNFAKIPSKDVVGRLKIVAEKESISVSEAALFEIAKLGRGSMRDSLNFFEQIYTAIGGKSFSKTIEETHVQKYFGTAGRKGIFDIIDAVINNNYAIILERVNDLIVANANIKDILCEISEVFRSIMVLKASNGDPKLLDIPDSEIQQLKNWGEKIKLSQLDSLIRAFANVNKEIEFSINDRWVFESTLLRCASVFVQTA